MTNFDNYMEKLTQDSFIQSMILNCDGCLAYPCNDNTPIFGDECEEELMKWCQAEV